MISTLLVSSLCSWGMLFAHMPVEQPPIVQASRELTPEAKIRQAKIARCLAIFHTRQVNADYLRPWSVMHGLIAYGSDALITSGGEKIGAVEFLCNNGMGDDRRILSVKNGKIEARVGPGVQGHEAQLLAMLAQSNVSIDHPIRIDGKHFTVRDLVEYEKLGCRSSSELTFKIIALAHYVDSDEIWANQSGQKWSLSRLIYEELAQPVNNGACGGSHRLMALSLAVRERFEQDKPVDGQWSRARNFVKSYHQRAFDLQNADGSFSTNWFSGPGISNDKTLQLYTTGHILEWMVYSLSPQNLDDPKISKAVDFLVNALMQAPNFALDVGPRGHAIHALRMYELRMYESLSDINNLSVQDVAVIEKLPVLTRPPRLQQPAERNAKTQPRRRGHRLFGRR